MLRPLYIILLNGCQTIPDKGGIARYCHEVASHLAERGHAVTVIAYPLRGSDRDPAHLPYRLLRRRSFDLARLVEKGGTSRAYLYGHLPPKVLAMAATTAREVLEARRQGAEPVLWAVTWWPEAIAARLVSGIFRLPYVVTAHGTESTLPTETRRHLLYRKILGGASRVFAVSRHTASCLLRCGVDGGRIRVIPNGIRPGEFLLTPERERLVEAMRREFGLEGKFVLLTIARLVPRKGHHLVLEALEGIRDRAPALRYVVAGEGPEGASLRREVQRHRLEDRVIFTGEVSDEERTALLHLCDLFVMPNRDILRKDGTLDTEGFGIVFLEAAACSKPVIGGRAGGAEEAVSDGLTGLLVDPERPEDLQRALLRLSHDRGLCTRLGREGRRRVEREFTWAALVGRYEDELRRICGRRESVAPC